MGGYVALKAASSLPGLKGIVSLGTKFDWDESSAEKERALLDAEALQASAPEFMALLRERHVLRDVKELFADTGELMQRLGSGEDRLREEEIAAVSCPVFISRGAKDRMVSEAESRGMASRYLRGSYVEVPETPHAWEKVNTNLIQELIARSFSLD
jgi:pimeloyl-ACP methyl ester carboxylesterase